MKHEGGEEAQHCYSVALLNCLERVVTVSTFWTGLQCQQCIHRCRSSVLKGKPKVIWNALASDNLANYDEGTGKIFLSRLNSPLLLHFSNYPIFSLKCGCNSFGVMGGREGHI